MTAPKFRTWSLPDKTMWEVVAIDFDDKQVTMFNEERYNDSFTMGFENVVLMQSTGLFDENGIEIFEGDIVKYLGVLVIVRFDNAFGVYFEYEDGDVDFPKVHTLEMLKEFKEEVSDTFTVIGNIYENQELLEETK